MLKMVHTADLHLGRKWKKWPRWEDNQRVLGEILDYAEVEQIDLLVFAGDIIDDRCEPDAETLLAEFIRRLLPAMRRGTGIVLVPGNHDRAETFDLVGTVLREVAGPEALPLLVCSRPDIYPAPGHPELQVIAWPYVSPVLLRSGDAFGAPVREGAELNETLSGQLGRRLAEVAAQADRGRPAIFVGHVQLAGIIAGLRELSYHDGLILTADALPDFTQYNALGHVHLAQPVPGGDASSWYCGAPDRQDLGERDHQPVFLRVDLTLQPGERCTPQAIPLQNAVPFISAHLEGPERVHAFTQNPPPRETLGQAMITCDALEFYTLRSEILAVCPRLLVERAPLPNLTAQVERAGALQRDLRAVAREVLAEQYRGDDLAERLAALEQLFEELGA
jgi:exonuclease SbcD